MKGLSAKHAALLSGMSDIPMTVGGAMRAGGYASRSAARKGLEKLLDFGYAAGEFGEAPGFGTVTKRANFYITPKGRAALSD